MATLGWFPVGAAVVLLFGGCDPKREDGRFCQSNADCDGVCHRLSGPEGDGECRPPKSEGEACTRPDFVENDCDTGLRCGPDAICVRGAFCPEGPCLAGEICLEPYDYCVTFCERDDECDDGCCGPVEPGAPSVCFSASECS